MKSEVLWIAGGAAAFVFYLGKLGYERGKSEKPFASCAAQVAAVIDSERLGKLTAAIGGGTLEIITTRKANDEREVRIARGRGRGNTVGAHLREADGGGRRAPGG